MNASWNVKGPWSNQINTVIRSCRHGALCLLVALLALAAHTARASEPTDPIPPSARDQARIAADYGRIPLSFEQNRGQSDASVQFLSRGSGYALFLTPGEAVLKLQRGAKAKEARSAILRMTLSGAKAQAAFHAEEPQAGTINYFHGNEQGHWATDVKTFGRVRYTAVYPGIDLVYYGNQRQLEYDFIVAPGADPKAIALNFSGASAALDKNGDLVLTDHDASTSFHKPVVYQLAGEVRVAVKGAYALHGQRVTFALGAYDHSKQLVIDPVLTYATFLGGNQSDVATGIAVDSAGSAYIVGDTESYNFPVAAAYKGTNTAIGNGFNLFVSKLNPTGTALVYSTYLGGNADSHSAGIAVDSAGSAYITGYTNANDYPVTSGAFQTLCGADHDPMDNRIAGCGSSDDISAVVTKLSPAGNSLVYSTFVGDQSYPGGIAVDSAGEAFIVGSTDAYCGNGPYGGGGYRAYQCYPTTSGAVQNGTLIQGGGGTASAAFLTKLSADGSTLLYSTLYGAAQRSNPTGGQNSVTGKAVAVDSSGNAYMTGNALGSGAPTTAGAFFYPPANSSTVLPPNLTYVAKFNPTLSGASSLVYVAWLGSAAQAANGSNYNNSASGIVVDGSGNAIVAGSTNFCGFPTTTGAYEPTTGSAPYCQDGFISKLNAAGTALVWSTLFGTAPSYAGQNAATNTAVNGIAQGVNGNLYVAATTSGGTVPTVNPIEKLINGGAYIAEFDPTGSKLLFSTPISGYNGVEAGNAIAVDPVGNMYLTGKVDYTTPTIPITSGAVQAAYGGGFYDAYVVKVGPLFNSTSTLSLSAASVNAGAPVTFTAVVAGTTGNPTATGNVTFLNGATSLGTGVLDGTGKAVFTLSTLAVGSYSVTASYPGDTNFNPSVSTPAQALAVVTNVTSTTLAASATTALTGISLTFTASVSPASGTLTPGGTVTFKDGNTTLGTGTLSGGKTTYTTSALAVGAHSITASYGGDSNDNSSASAATAVTITAPPPDFALTFSQTSGTIAAGSSLTVTITEAPANGFAAATTFACSGLPIHSTCTFTPPVLTPSGTASVSTTLVIATNVAAAALELPVQPGSAHRDTTVALATLLFLPLAGLRNRKLRRLLLSATLIALAAFATFSVTGCAGAGSIMPQSVTPSGVYAVTVTATSGTVVHSAVYNVTVQ